jgi:hypothetical protein
MFLMFVMFNKDCNELELEQVYESFQSPFFTL